MTRRTRGASPLPDLSLPPDEPKPWEPVVLIVLILIVVIAVAVACGALAKWIIDEAVRILRP